MLHDLIVLNVSLITSSKYWKCTSLQLTDEDMTLVHAHSFKLLFFRGNPWCACFLYSHTKSMGKLVQMQFVGSVITHVCFWLVAVGVIYAPMFNFVGVNHLNLVFSSLTASPPRFVSVEELMETAKGVTNMALAHEILVNHAFQVKSAELPEGR